MCAPVQQTRTRKRVEAELKEAKSKLAKVQKVHREVEGALEAKTAIKAYTAEMFGQKMKKGGGPQYRKTRHEALNRVRACGHLSMEQENDWQLFAKEWDAAMADVHGEAWGSVRRNIGEHSARIGFRGRQRSVKLHAQGIPPCLRFSADHSDPWPGALTGSRPRQPAVAGARSTN